MQIVKRAVTATARPRIPLLGVVFSASALTTSKLNTSASPSGQTAHPPLRVKTKVMASISAGVSVDDDVAPRAAATTHPVPKLAKRKVALFVAYVGSSFRGLQIQTKSPGGTVEDVLQQAIYEMGGILPSNYGTLQKVGWTRSSRTDKGVHALANVLAMKLECNPASFEADPEGTQLAAAMNAYLPPEVRVLSVQRVNGGFNARGYCRTRTYDYYLPASILGLTGDGKREGQMGLMRQCCDLYRGNNPFHNYTKRKLYRMPADSHPEYDPRMRRATEDAAAALKQAQLQTPAEAQSPLETAQTAEPQQATAQLDSGTASEEDDWEVISAPQQEMRHDSTAAEHQSSGELGSGAPQQDVATTSQLTPSEAQKLPRPLQYRWLDEMDPKDMLAKPHYRYINDITVHDPEPLGPAQTPAVKVAITGSSFMLHQIRHMIGAAVAVARGNLPLDFVAASLCAPARTALPLAPSEVLVLADNTFQPFPTDTTPASAALQALSGNVLQLREHGLNTQAEFEQKVLNPALERLLEDKVWGEWDENLNRLSWQDDELAEFTQKARTWRAQRAAISSAKKQHLAAAQQ